MLLISGGAGFIGSHTAIAALNDGESVRVFDNLITGDRANLDGLDVAFVEGDIRDPDALLRAMRGCDRVIHLAAKVSVPGSVADPLGFEEVNGRGFVQVLEAAKECGVSRVVYASSSAVYGSSALLPKEEGQPLAPESPYAVAKAGNELYGSVYSRSMGLSCVGLRYFNVFGPRQDPKGPYAAVIPRFVEQALAGRQLTIFGDGEQGRDFVSVGDVARANLMASRTAGAAGRVFNIGGGKMRTVNELGAIVQRVVGREVGAAYLPERPGDVRYSVSDISAAKDVLGWSPEADFGSALAETIEWYRDFFSS
jgi:nucleoside-diphosphate-sugar epimerase